MKIKNYISFIALAIFMLFTIQAKASSSTTTANGNIASNSNWTSSPSSADTLYVNHDMTFSNVDWRSSSSMVVTIGSSGSISPTGTNAKLRLPAGSKLPLDTSGQIINNSGNNSNHEISIGWTCVWGKHCCPDNTTITGLAQVDTLNVCSYDPLPVKLVSFTGIRHGNSVTVSWVTVEEFMSSHFILERSTDGINFKQIARVNSKVNSNSISEYQVEDILPQDISNSPNIFYRLSEVSLEGDIEVFNLINVRSSLLPSRVEISNPIGGGEIVINANEHSGGFTATIYSIDGRVLTSVSSSEDVLKLDINDMPYGIMILTIKFDNSDYVFSQKVLKTY